MKLCHLSRIFPIFILGPILLSTCAQSPLPLDNSPNMQPPSEIISPVESTSLESVPTSDPEVPDVWDVSNVHTQAIDPQRKLIAFTFDDAPAKTMESIFAVFASYNETHPSCPAFATVFFNGKLFDSQTPHLLATACALGFELGNHTHSHYDLTTLDKATLQAEIDNTDALLQAADGKPRHLLRAPFGKVNELVKTTATAPLIDWTIDTLDWTGVSEDEIFRTVYENKFSGAIVLMHDGYPHTIGALKRLLPALYEDGYQVVGVSQLAKMHHCTFKKGKVYIRARKQQSNF